MRLVSLEKGKAARMPKERSVPHTRTVMHCASRWTCTQKIRPKSVHAFRGFRGGHQLHTARLREFHERDFVGR